jgi:hypothetical protein
LTKTRFDRIFHANGNVFAHIGLPEQNFDYLCGDKGKNTEIAQLVEHNLAPKV